MNHILAPKVSPKATTIMNMLRAMGVSRSGVLFVHSAFKQFSKDGYQVVPVLEALMNYMAAGTLLLPTMSWRYVKSHTPFFDELKTPSNTGILTEVFRQNYATHRSLHPTHSVAAIGPDAEALLNTHHLCVTPCGFLSPFGKLVEADAFIIMLGVGMDCCTLIHHVEEITHPELYVKPESEIESYECLRRNGEKVTVLLRRHLFLPRNYWQFQDQLAAQGDLYVFRCDNSICIGFFASKLFQVVKNSVQCNPPAIIARPGQRYRMM